MPVKEKDKKGGGRASRAGEFIREIRSELRKVVWPTRQEAVKLTTIVILVCVAVGFFLGLMDATFTQMFQIILR